MADVISSRDNKWLKQFRAALRGTGPHDGDLIGVEGPKLVEEALRSGLEAEALLVSEAGRAARLDESSMQRAKARLEFRDRACCAPQTSFSKASPARIAPQGVAALFRQREWGFDDVLRGSGTMNEISPLVIVLAALQDPGNVGTILRSAEAFGATGAVAARGTADPWSPKALRASAGSALRLPVLRGIAIPVLLAQLKMAKVKIYAASSAHGNGGGKADLREAAAIFVGNESSGVPAEVERAADAIISIPMAATVESLNAGVAASLVLYEAARQRMSAAKGRA